MGTMRNGIHGGAPSTTGRAGRSQSESAVGKQARRDEAMNSTAPQSAPPTVKRSTLTFLKERLTTAEWPYDPMAFFGLALLPYLACLVGLSPFWMLPVSFLGLSYLHNLAQQHKRKTAMQLANDPRVVKAVTKHLPTWFFDSEVERGVWLTQCIKKLWPTIAEIIGTHVPATVKPILDYLDCKRPAFIDDVRITKLWLGTIPISICGVRYVSTTDDVVQLDLDVKWAGDSQLKLELGYKGWPLVIEVSKIVLRGKIRLELGPLVPRLPILSGAVNLTFMEEPFLDFSINIFALNVAAVGMPDLSVGDTVAWVIRESCFREAMYYPSRLVIPILHDIVDRRQLKRRNAMGRLGLTIVSATDLTAADWSGLSDPYVKITYRPQNQIHRTEFKTQTLNPTWDREFWLDVFDLKEGVHLEVKDHDVMGHSDPIGDVWLKLNEEELAGMAVVEKELKLENVQRGTLKVRIMFVPSDAPQFLIDEEDEEEEEVYEDNDVRPEYEGAGSPPPRMSPLLSTIPESISGTTTGGGGKQQQASSSSSDAQHHLSSSASDTTLPRGVPADFPGASTSTIDSSERLSGLPQEGILHLSELRLMGYRIKSSFGGTAVSLQVTLGETVHKTRPVKGPCVDPGFTDTLTFRVCPATTSSSSSLTSVGAQQPPCIEVAICERNAVTGERVITRKSIELSRLLKKTSKTEMFYVFPHKNHTYRLHMQPTFIRAVKGNTSSSSITSKA